MRYFLLFCAVLTALNAAESHPQTLTIGSPAPDFHLPGVDGKTYSLADFKDAKVLVVVFTCNHCPTAQLYEGRIKALAADYKSKGVDLVAINPNDPKALRLDELGYTDMGDTFAEMKIRAAYRHFNFPYLYDGATQAVARQYGPVATPHVFIFDQSRKLRYEGRIDSSVRENLAKIHDARDAIDALLAGKPVAVATRGSVGCSIKWSAKEGGAAAEMTKIEQEPVKVEMVDAGGLKKLRQNPTGKMLLVNFWATWCGPCVSEMPELQKTWRMYRNRAFDLVTVSANFPDEKAGVLRALEKPHASTRNLLFGTTDTYGLEAAFDPKWKNVVPYTMLIRADGTVAWSYQGALDGVELRRIILANMPDDDYIGIRAHWSKQ